ncbi:helix-turn-helix domain-containing protein [Spirosoma utsteinense]|uniref:AraC-like DNA-binding protein n=1 Tax=Spirosoma utsteinense TaxID=2585773 RepID=A0ABR6W7S8_9BACT|nr:AraC family transcriptional regulator [Spirosoma utsteinense]MBC3789041.1 AraC-like DNA-binding protein [Spirosoma utsteinense]MBC3792633.1 AraC-like DNA-binding protein [Spirosoma utsteinense]
MKRYILHTPFNIYHFEATTWLHAVHKHTYFEIIFILKGKGLHHINGNTFGYSQGDVFLLGPEDYHDFVIQEVTEFCFIRFNESSHKHPVVDKDSPWQPIIHTLLTTSSQSRGSIVVDKQEKQKLHHLLMVLEEEYERNQSPYFAIIRDSLMRSMLIILARNLFGQTLVKPGINASVEAILMYVRQHIYQPKELSIEHLADVFHYAPAYISLFFKKQTGESLKKYIIKHRIKLIEARLLYSPLTLAQIADEFGYTDESHFCKQFRKYTGSTPTAFRRQT